MRPALIVAAAYIVRCLPVMHAIDFGWSYEPALRITRGQVPFSDFVTTQPPLHQYTLALLMKLLGTSVWSYQIHLYFLWLLSGAAAWWLARSLDVPRGAAAGVALVALLLNPPFYMGHEYNYTASTLIAIGVVFAVRARKTSSSGAAGVVGALFGLALFAKQNVGLVLIAGGLVAFVVTTNAGRRARLAGAFVAGAATVVALVGAYFAAHAGTGEFLHQFLIDPAEGKGGLAILARALPHLNLDFLGRARVIGGVAVGFALIGVVMAVLRRSASPDAAATGVEWLRRWMWVLPVITIAVAIVSAVASPALARLSAESPFRIWFWSGLVAQAFALLCYAVAAFVALRTWRTSNHTDLLLACLLAAVVVAHAGGSWNYPFTMGAVAAPVVGRLLWRSGAARWVTHGVVAMSAVLIVLHFSVDGWNIHAFQPLSTVPAGNPFSGLRAFPAVADGLDEIAREVTPRVRGHRTLWLTNPFPYAAFGGDLVKADTAIDAGAYSPRPERALMKSWLADPPDVVVYAGSLLVPPTSTVFSAPSITQWLRESYTLAATLQWGGMTVWTKKRLTAKQAAPPSAQPPTFRLYFLGHEIGREDDSVNSKSELTCVVHFDDRGTAIDLKGAFEPSASHLVVKGRNYRLFSSDSDVRFANGRAHVRDLGNEREIDLAGKPFFPIDNYAPFCAQEALIKYWIAHGRPAEIASAPSGPIRIASRATQRMTLGHGDDTFILERLSIDGVVWGTETAWILAQGPRAGELQALTTWAGALPFEAVASTNEGHLKEFLDTAIVDRVGDLERLTQTTPPLQSTTFALVGGRILAGAAMAPIENATLVVRDGRIAQIGPSSAILVPRTVPAVDVRGKTIIPGLWDTHAHASQIDWAPVYLASGVTTIRDMGGEEGVLIAIRDAIKSGRALGPRYLLAGLVDGPGPRAFGAVTAGTPDEGRTVVRRYHDEGFEQIKIYSLVTPDVVKAIVDEAHTLGMTVTGHVPNGMTSQSVVEAGFDQIAHMQLRGASGSDASKQQIAFFKAHGTVMDPTESWNELSGRPGATPLDSLLPGVSRLPAPLARMFASMSAGSGDPQAVHARLIESVKLLKDAIDAGLLVVAGTDKGVPGFSLQRELELYVEGGMTPVQALQTATIMPARAIGLDSETGTIEGGKRADFVVLDANPLETISNIRTARLVSSNGTLYDCDALWSAAGFLPRAATAQFRQK